jgi:hypothetical protein
VVVAEVEPHRRREVGSKAVKQQPPREDRRGRMEGCCRQPWFSSAVSPPRHISKSLTTPGATVAAPTANCFGWHGWLPMRVAKTGAAQVARAPRPQMLLLGR